MFIILLTAAAGVCIPLGGFLASFEHIRPNWLETEFRHFVIAVGGGILTGAVALVLVPEGVARMGHSFGVLSVFVLGGVVFFFIERILGLQRRARPQLMGMLLDYVPEAIALGGLVALGAGSAPLLALLIGLQNLPEGFNSFRELATGDNKGGGKTLGLMLSLTALGPVAGLLGYFFLAAHEAVLGGIMLFASGGILYLIFQDIAPQSRLRRHWAPPLGAVLGFGFALFGRLWLNPA